MNPRLTFRLTLLVILLFAAFLRFYQLDLVDVRFDEASIPQHALSVSRGNFLAVVPFSGSVANHPPFMLYLLAIPWLLGKNFLGVVAFRVLLDVAAVGGTGLLCRRFFSARVAYLAALLFAVAPWAVQTARKTSGEALPLFSVVLLWGLLRLIEQRRTPDAHQNKSWLLVGLGVALAVGTHLSALVLVPVVCVAVVLVWRTLRAKPMLLGALPCLLLAALYLGHDATQGWANLKSILKPSDQPATLSLNSWQFATWLGGGAHLSDLTGDAFAQWQAQVPALLNSIDVLPTLLLVAFLVWVVIELVRQPKATLHSPHFMLAIWFGLPVLLLLRETRPLQLHYLLPLYPVQFVMLALVLDKAIARRKSFAYASYVVIALLVSWQVFATFRFYNFVQTYNTGNGGYGAPLRGALQAAALATNANFSGDVIVVAPGGDPLVHETATLFDVLLAGKPHRFVNANEAMILRPNTRYIFAPNTEKAFAQLARYAAINTKQAVPLRANSTANYVVVETGSLELTQLHRMTNRVIWQNGARLFGYTVLVHNNDLQAEIFIAAPAPPAQDFHWYHHVYAGNQKIAQMDLGGVQPQNWREGDVLLHWLTIPLPDNWNADMPVLSLRVGCYAYPSLAGVMLLDDANNPFDDGVSLPLL